MLDHAVHYAGRAWPVFPLVPGDKVPLGAAAPHGFQSATLDLDTIRRWWEEYPGAGIGVATGEPSGLLVVDLDGDEGAQTWRGLISEHGLVLSLTQRTGGGGWQVFFRRPSGGRCCRTRALPGIDVRCDGGYVVVPPSLHPDGPRYRWVADRQIAECPAWLLEALYPPMPTRPTAVVASPRVDPLVRLVSAAEVGRRNAVLYWAACRAVEQDLCTDDLATAARVAGLPDREIERTIASARRRA